MTNERDQVTGEHALRDGENDRLGFRNVAERIATSIVDRASVDGLVIGLEGQWGAGKSSLLHLIRRSLDQIPEEERPTVINFRPWLVGDRDALLTALLSELADKISHVSFAKGNKKTIRSQRAQKAADAIRVFARALGKTGGIVETAGEYWAPLKLFGKALTLFGKAAEKEKIPNDLSTLKMKITSLLKDINHRFIVTIDDVDRLEPSEAIEVLRLVRSVADFPNLIYILCYDTERLAEAIQKGANVEDGNFYLEKIVQLTVMVPKPEAYELRQWFSEQINELIGPISDYELHQRIKNVIDREGGVRLKTPRAVVRTLDAIRFLWPAIRDEKLDVADLIWLQLIKNDSPKLYRWIEIYVATSAAISFGTAAVTESGREESLKELIDQVADRSFDDATYRQTFADTLPGIHANYGRNDPPFSIFEPVHTLSRQSHINLRRLSSPDHYRIYFGLIKPTHAISQYEFSDLWEASRRGSEITANFFTNIHSQTFPNSLHKSDVLFERLQGMDPTLLSFSQARNILLALGEMMDDARDTEENLIVTTWDRAERLIPILYSRLGNDQRAETTQTLFAHGRALGWLTSVLREEIFAHGRFGNRKKTQDEWLLPDPEFELACQTMVARYRSMTIGAILASPRPLGIFFAWSQAGYEAEPREAIANSTRTDEGLVEVLSAFTTSVESSNRGRYTVLNKEYGNIFFDYDVAISRLKAIATSGRLELRSKAQELVDAANESFSSY